MSHQIGSELGYSNIADQEDSVILYKKEEAVAIITLNRPHRYNAVNTELVKTLNSVLSAIRDDDTIRAIVLTGAGKGFCAGADIDTFGKITPEGGRAYITSIYGPLMRTFLTLRKPIVGAINGTAAGVGAAIALACDLRVMGHNSALLYAFINLGLGPDGGAGWFLTRQVGYSRAFEIAIAGEKLPAQRCLELGLTNKLVETEALLPTALAWAKSLAQKPTLAVGITKESLSYAVNNSLYDSIAYEAEKQVSAFKSQDLKEGVQAFIEKRPAQFTGK